ncbi:MAG: iron-containing alcohol dehydrogenase [Synergistaceae bacterium]|jgi:glycerol-1-phosphate dehydrogenase [NAD(P)+]|nr:iron-containing alcohol dehydrogenase [Synergistaceae bacterium]
MRNPADLTGREILCECGRTHRVPIREIRRWEGAIPPEAFSGIFSSAAGMSALMICDAHTMDSANGRVAESLRRAGWKLKVREFSRDRLVNDEAAVGAAVLDADTGVGVIIAVGGGTVTDLGRFVASRTCKPFALVMTCPSMDGYASNIAAVSLDGRRRIFKDCRYPDAIFCDMEVMRSAPMELIASGFGDMLGERTSLPDWVMSRHFTGERFCGMLAALMDDSSMECASRLDGIISRDAAATGALTDALLLAGISMGLAGDTRPVSGSEHIFSHFMAERGMEAGTAAPHGATVGFGTLISTLLYEYLLDELRPSDLAPVEAEIRRYLLPSAQIADLLAVSGIGVSAGRYLPGSDVADMIHVCAAPDKRYTVLRYLADAGRIEDGIRHVVDALGRMGESA